MAIALILQRRLSLMRYRKRPVVGLLTSLTFAVVVLAGCSGEIGADDPSGEGDAAASRDARVPQSDAATGADGNAGDVDAGTVLDDAGIAEMDSSQPADAGGEDAGTPADAGQPDAGTQMDAG